MNKLEKFLGRELIGGERHHMKLKDKAIEEERARDREVENVTANKNSTVELIIEHFSHPHPLIYMEPDYASFVCDSCGKKGNGKRFHCTKCNFDLHKVCAQTPISWLQHHKTPDEMETSGIEQGDIVESFAHPQHLLVSEYRRRPFKCDHCNNFGDGLRFCCQSCMVEVDNVCANNPTRLITYLHPQHELELKLRPTLKNCSLCGTAGPSNNRMYRCKECQFYLHPSCSQWPLNLVHPLHPPHRLVLKPSSADYSENTCSACWGLMGKYKYSCEPCGIHFGLGCIKQQSRLGVGEDVRKNHANQQIDVLPITNLPLPDTRCQRLVRGLPESEFFSRANVMSGATSFANAGATLI